MLQRCPEQFRQRYILGRKEPPGEARVLGSAVHVALEHNWQQKIDSHEDVPAQELEEFYADEAWPSTLERVGGQGEVVWDSQPEQARDLGLLMTRAYRASTTQRVQPIAVEQWGETRIEGLPVPLVGRIDVETETSIVDTKTSKAKRTSLKPDWRLQARVYQLLRPGKAVDYHVLTKAKQPTVWTPLEAEDLTMLYTHRLAEKTAQHILELASLANYLWELKGPDQPWPQLGIGHDWACSYCGYRSTCPAWTE